jgi:hypothetical protein
MALKHWLFGALTAAAIACGSDPDYTRDGGSASGDDDSDDDSSESSVDAGSGGRRDAGGGGKAPVTGNDDDDEGDDDDSEVCDSVDIQARPNAPRILIVLDRSGSMIGVGGMGGMGGQNRWEPSASAVKKVTSELNEVVHFGLMMFPSAGGGMMTPAAGADAGMMPGGGITIPGLGTIPIPGLPAGFGGDPCAAGKVDVEVDADKAQDIAAAIDRGAPAPTNMTPTASTLANALAAVEAECADCASQEKFVLLVTDGQPTCGMAGAGQTTQADIDATNAAIDKLREARVKTYVVGYDTKNDMALAATMDSFAMHGGTNTHLAVENEADLVNELRTIAGSLVSCEYELNDEVEDPSLVRVIIDGETLVLGQGWQLDGRRIVLDEGDGGACGRIKDGRVHNVKIKKDCEPRIFQ